MKKIDLSGKKFGYLTVIKQAKSRILPSGRKQIQWLCMCDCGKEVIVSSPNLKTGNTKSCGCMRYIMMSKTQRENNRNKYDLTNEYGIGYTKNGNEFYFDLEDYEKISKFKWNITQKGYIATIIEKNGNKHLLFMHRLVMNPPNNCQVDHIKGRNSKTDNRKCNLRVVTNSQNRMNTPLQKNNTSGTTGVYWIEHMKKWNALIGVNKSYINLGYFEELEDAKKARKDAENKYFGEYSYNNSQEH